MIFFRTALTAGFPSLGAIALSLMVAGCEKPQEPPAQLEADLSLNGSVDDRQRIGLAGDILSYLAVPQLRPEQARVALDEARKTYVFRIVDRQALPKEQLDQVAARIAQYETGHQWQAKLTISSKSKELDEILKTQQREFPLELDWRNADVSVYVSQISASMTEMPVVHGASEQRSVLCMLSFRPSTEIPKLQLAPEEMSGLVFGPKKSSPAAIRYEYSLRAMGRITVIPHEVSFQEPLLEKAFDAKSLEVRDASLMFRFAEFATSGIVGTGGGPNPMEFDMGGRVETERRKKLEAGFPAVHQKLLHQPLYARVKGFGPARVLPLPVPEKSS